MEMSQIHHHPFPPTAAAAAAAAVCACGLLLLRLQHWMRQSSLLHAFRWQLVVSVAPVSSLSEWLEQRVPCWWRRRQQRRGRPQPNRTTPWRCERLQCACCYCYCCSSLHGCLRVCMQRRAAAAECTTTAADGEGHASGRRCRCFCLCACDGRRVCALV